MTHNSAYSENLEDKRTKAVIAVVDIRSTAQARGNADLSLVEIQAEIAQVRRERRENMPDQQKTNS